MPLPNDPIILMSVLNTKLRDTYSSLDELCDDLEENKQKLIDQCASAGYLYSEEYNRFI